MDAIALARLVEMPDGHRPMILQQAGGLAGFMGYVAFAPSCDVRAFVSVNRMDFGMDGDLSSSPRSRRVETGQGSPRLTLGRPCISAEPRA